jgi:hypothetical protein
MTSRELFDKSGIDVNFSGATTVSLLIIDNIIWCSNIGDSRAVNKIILYLKILCSKNKEDG